MTGFFSAADACVIYRPDRDGMLRGLRDCYRRLSV